MRCGGRACVRPNVILTALLCGNLPHNGVARVSVTGGLQPVAGILSYGSIRSPTAEIGQKLSLVSDWFVGWRVSTVVADRHRVHLSPRINHGSIRLPIDLRTTRLPSI
jgi:hypothetical protein